MPGMSSMSTPTDRSGDPAYPKMMSTSAGLVVLFHQAGRGVVVQPGPNTDQFVGRFSDSWTMSNFATFRGTVSITTDY